ncbi:MAG: sulfite exporter TauE/SafE family protein [Dehalococcoidia bacterium]|nr:sulfite exporter TauE/SafE family protein [Dehalococcoidia bacterium]
MITFSEVPGLEASPVVLLFLGFALGVLAGFVGVGGGFIVTPALIVMGFPAPIAVGTGLAHISGNAVVATMRHRQLGNVDLRLGALTVIGTLAGVEGGVALVNWLKDRGVADEGVLSASLALMAFISVFTVWETRRSQQLMAMPGLAGDISPRELVSSGLWRRLHALRLWPMVDLPRSRVRISFWVLIVIGFFTGVLAGLIGVGGGFVLNPALIYLVGVPSHLAVGTGLLQMIFTASYGTLRHTMSANVLIFASLLLLIGASLGTQVGAVATAYVTGPTVRLVLALAVGLAAAGTAFELADVLTDETIGALDAAATITLFGGIAFLTVSIAALLVLGVLYRRGRSIPRWVEPLCCKR